MKKNSDSKRNRSAGFTAIEMLVTLGIGMVVVASVVGTFTTQLRQNRAEEQVGQMQQNARAALDLMVREIQMARYDPLGTALTSTYGVVYNASQLQIQADMDGNGTIDAATSGSVENIIYAHDSANRYITRKLGTNGTAQILADNITAFTFNYYDANGNPVTSTANSGDIRKVALSITARTAAPDPSYTANGGYRTYQISADVTPPNLATVLASTSGGGGGSGGGSTGDSSGGSDKDDKDKKDKEDKDKKDKD